MLPSGIKDGVRHGVLEGERKGHLICTVQNFKMKKIPMTSLRQDWRTPKTIYETLDFEFDFKFDPCPSNAAFDGLSMDWGSPAFVNPPFKHIAKWVQKAYFEYLKGKTVVLFIPSRTDTRWWHDYCLKASEIRFIKGRIKYEGAKHDAPFPSCLVIFEPCKILKHGA